MSKFKKSILIIGILIIVIAASLGTALALFATGSIVTDPIDLTFRVRDKEQYYNGNALTINATLRNSSNPDGDVDFADGFSSADLLPGHRVVLTPSYSNGEKGVTSVTDVKNPVTADVAVKILDADDFNVTKKYNIKVEPGTLTVKPQQLKLKLNIDENGKEYDGTQLVFNSDDFIITGGKIVTGHRVVSTNNVGIVDVGDKIPADFKPHVFDASGNDVTSNYDVILENSSDTIKINPRWIYFKPKDIIKTYDGQPAVCELEFLEGTSLADGQFAEFEIVDDDNASNFIDARPRQKIRIKDIKIYQMVDGVKRDVTSNYTLTDMQGEIQIDKANVTLIAESWTWTYNGQSHSLYSNETLPEENIKGLFNGDRVSSIKYDHDCSITNVGVIDNLIESYVISNIDNYNVTTVAGKLEVKPVKMTITTKSYDAYYNGEPVVNYQLVNGKPSVDYSVSYEDKNYVPVSSHFIDVDVNASARSVIDVVDRLENSLVYDIKDVATGISVKKNYEITENFGYFTIRKVTIYVKLNNTLQTLTFNGKEQTPELLINEITTDVPNSYNYKLTVNKSCFKLKNNTGEKIMNAGKYQCSVDFVDDVRNLSQNYNLKVIDGAYIEAVIEAVNISVTLLNYDDSPSGGASFEFANREFPIDMVSSVVAVEPSKSSVNFGIDDVDWSKVKLSIFTRKGTDISNYVYTEAELKNGGTYYYNVQIVDEQYKKNVKMVCANDNGYATIRVKRRNLDVEIRNVTHVYDGTNYKFDAYTVITYIGDNPSGLTKDDFYIDYITIADSNPGSLIDMDASLIVMEETQGYKVALKGVNADNYTLVIDNPEVSMKGNTSPDRAKFDYAVYFVLKYTLNVTTGSQEYTYDGKEHVNKEFTCSELPSNAFAADYLDSETNVKVKEYTEGDGVDNVFGIKVYKKNNPAANLALQYFNIIYNYGKLKVNKKNIQLTLPEINSQYNSTSLPNYTSDAMAEYANYAKEECGMPSGHEFYVKNLYGESGNEILSKNLTLDSVGVLRGFVNFGVTEDDNDVSDNYDIELVEAVLRITPCEVVLTLKDITLKYKNAVLNTELDPKNVYNGTLSDGLNSTDLKVEFDRDVQDVGKYTYNLVIANSVKSKNFVIIAAPGKITVEKREVTVYIKDFIDAINEEGNSEITRALDYDGNIKTISVFNTIESIDLNKKEGDALDMAVEFRAVDFEIIPLSEFKNAKYDGDYYRYEINFKDRNYLNNYKIVIKKNFYAADLSDYDKNVGLLQIRPLEVTLYDVDTSVGDKKDFFTFKEYEIMPTVDMVIYTNVSTELLPLSVFTLSKPITADGRWGVDAGVYDYEISVNKDDYPNFRFTDFEILPTVTKQFTVYAVDEIVVLKDYDNVTFKFDEYGDPIEQEILKSAILSGLSMIDKVELVAKGNGVAGRVENDNFYVTVAGNYYYNIVSTDKNRNYIAQDATIIVRGAIVDPEFAVPEYTYRGESIVIEAKDVIDLEATNAKYGTEASDYNFRFVQEGSDGIVHNGSLTLNGAGLYVVQIVYEDDPGVISMYNFTSTVEIAVQKSTVSVTLVSLDEANEFSTVYYDGNVHEVPRELILEFGVVQEDETILQGNLNVLDFVTVVPDGRTVKDAGDYAFNIEFRFSEYYESFDLVIANPEDAVFSILPIDVTVALDYSSVTYSAREIIPEASTLIKGIAISDELSEALGGLDISNMLTADDFKFRSAERTIVAKTYEYDVVIADKKLAGNFNLTYVGTDAEGNAIEGHGEFVIKPYRIYLVLSPITATSRGELTDMQGSVSVSSTSPIRGEDFFRITFAITLLDNGGLAYLINVEIDWTGCEDRMSCYEIIGSETMSYLVNGEVVKTFEATEESIQNSAVARYVLINQG